MYVIEIDYFDSIFSISQNNVLLAPRDELMHSILDKQQFQYSTSTKSTSTRGKAIFIRAIQFSVAKYLRVPMRVKHKLTVSITVYGHAYDVFQYVVLSPNVFY